MEKRYIFFFTLNQHFPNAPLIEHFSSFKISFLFQKKTKSIIQIQISKLIQNQKVNEQVRAGAHGIVYILDIFERNDTNQQFYRVFNLFGKKNVGVLRRAGFTYIVQHSNNILFLLLSHCLLLRVYICVCTVEI